MSAITCKKCGKENDTKKNYCVNCGASIKNDNTIKNGFNVFLFIATIISFVYFIIANFYLTIRLDFLTFNRFISQKGMILDLLIIVIIALLGLLLKGRKTLVFYMIVMPIISYIICLNYNYYSVYYSFYSFSLVGELDITFNATSFMFFLPSIIYIVLAGITLILSIVFRKMFIVKKNKKGLIMTVVTILLLGLTSLITYIVIRSSDSVELARLEKKWDRASIVDTFGFFTYTISDFFDLYN